MDEVKKDPNLFDYIKDITQMGAYIYDKDTSKEYYPYMVNRGLSQNIDTILLANEMNKRPDISELMHHDFLFYAVDKKKRHTGKWAKANEDKIDLINFIKHKYSVNETAALSYLELYDEVELQKLIKEKTEKGGIEK